LGPYLTAEKPDVPEPRSGPHAASDNAGAVSAPWPQDPRGDGTGLRFETGEHGGDYPDNMPQAITATDAQGRWAVYVPLRVNGKIVVPDNRAH
jgi:hypothetical protein